MNKTAWLRANIVTACLGFVTYVLLGHKSTVLAGQVIAFLFAFQMVFVASALVGQLSWHYKLDNLQWIGSTVVALGRSEEHTSELQSLRHLVCRLLLEKKNK